MTFAILIISIKQIGANLLLFLWLQLKGVAIYIVIFIFPSKFNTFYYFIGHMHQFIFGESVCMGFLWYLIATIKFILTEVKIEWN